MTHALALLLLSLAMSFAIAARAAPATTSAAPPPGVNDIRNANTLPRAAPVLETLEWAATDADLVVRAKVDHAMRVGDRPAADGFVWFRVTVTVLQAYGADPDLKAAPWFDLATWRRDGDPTDPEYPWWTMGGEVLLFLDRPGRPGGPPVSPVEGCDFILRRHGDWLAPDSIAEQAVRLDGKHGVASVNRKWLTNPADILDRLRLAARQPRAPRVVIGGHPGFSTHLVVPANDLARREAIAWTPPGESREWRTWGARVLAQCPAPDAERALRDMLLDDEQAEGDLGIARSRTNPLRRAARDALTRLGLDTAGVVVDEPLDWHRPIGRSAAGAAILLLAILIAAAARARRRPARRPWPSVLLVTLPTTLLAVLTLGFLALWARSLTGVDSLRVAIPRRLLEVTSYAGRIQFRTDINTPFPPVIAAARFHPDDPADRAAWDPANLQPPNTWDHNWAGVAHMSDHGYGGPNLLIPYAWLTAALGVIPALTLLTRAHHHLRRRHRRRNNLCPVCGYDCRATPTACPECGAAPVG